MNAEPSQPRICAECGPPWIDARERLRSYLDGEEAPRLFCPGCAGEEVGDRT